MFAFDIHQIDPAPALTWKQRPRGNSKPPQLLPQMLFQSKPVNIVTFYDKGFATLYLINGGVINLNNCVFKRHIIPIGLCFARQTEEEGLFLFRTVANESGQRIEFTATRLKADGSELCEVGDTMHSASYTELYKRVAKLNVKGTPKLFLRGRLQQVIKQQMLAQGFDVASAPPALQALFQAASAAPNTICKDEERGKMARLEELATHCSNTWEQ